jgi:hypothetical protein
MVTDSEAVTVLLELSVADQFAVYVPGPGWSWASHR